MSDSFQWPHLYQFWCQIPFSDHTCTRPRLHSKFTLLLHWLHTACRHFVEQELEATNSQPPPILGLLHQLRAKEPEIEPLNSLPHTMKGLRMRKNDSQALIQSYHIQRPEPALRLMKSWYDKNKSNCSHHQIRTKLNWLLLHPAVTTFGTANRLKTPEGTPTTRFNARNPIINHCHQCGQSSDSREDQMLIDSKQQQIWYGIP